MTIREYAESAKNTFGTVVAVYEATSTSADQKADLIALIQPLLDAKLFSFPVVPSASVLADLVIVVGPILSRLA